MRSIKLVPIAAATAMLLALSPAGASARQVQRRSGTGRPCHIKLEVPNGPITSGESATIIGTLTCPANEVAAGRQVLLYQHAANRGAFALVGNATSEATKEPNVAAFAINPPVFEVNSVFFATSQGAKSAHRAIKVAPVVTPTPPTPPDGAQLFTGGGRLSRVQNTVTFTGKVSPLDRGAIVGLQRENATANEEWHRIAPVGTVNVNGEYSITHTFGVPGDASIRIVIHPRNRLNVAGASTPASYEISQAQNPLFTIESTADPLIWGHSVGIKGVVKGAAPKTPLTLLSRVKGGSFAPVATGETGEGGAYEFTQTPLRNTLYRVTDATASSAVLFEGVKYSLTVSSPPSSVAETQPVAFSGTVLPALARHVIYLERQNPSHIGWHVIDIGTVGSPASPAEAAPFSIVHAFNAAGPELLRVKIPGDPGNQGVASAPFELSVAQSPASTLRPEAPGNGRMPSEGQL
jgi:hypothetical protein